MSNLRGKALPAYGGSCLRIKKVSVLEYIFSFSATQGIFALPCDTVDLYINEASADDLRVLLFIFRHSGSALNEERLCRALDLTAEKVNRSLGFWVSKKLISLKPLAAEQPAAVPAPPAKKIIDSPTQYSAAEVSKKLHDNRELRFLLDAAPGLLGRLLSPAECSVFIYLYEGAGLPADVILMIIEYCVSSGHGNIRYIEKMALSWAEEGIDSHEIAESKICELEARRSFEGKIRSMMGITGRSLTAAERQHLNRWSQWGIPMELIQLSYEICVNRTGKLAFSYINSILSSWHEKGFTTVEQAKGENQQKNSKTPSYNIDEYVDLSMKRLLNE
jgi:DnaD/phage-associated family protein